MVVRRKDKKVEATNTSLTLPTTGQFNRCRLVIVEFASSRDETRRDGQRLIVASRHAPHNRVGKSRDLQDMQLSMLIEPSVGGNSKDTKILSILSTLSI